MTANHQKIKRKREKTKILLCVFCFLLILSGFSFLPSVFAEENTVIIEKNKTSGSLPAFKLGTLMPSDESEQKFSVKNISDDKIEYKISLKYDKTNENMKFLNICINENGDKIFNGKISDFSGTITEKNVKKNSVKTFDTVISVSKDADKVLDFNGSEIGWTMKVKRKAPEETKKRHENILNSPLVMTLMICFVFALIIFYILCKILKKEKQKKQKK